MEERLASVDADAIWSGKVAPGLLGVTATASARRCGIDPSFLSVQMICSRSARIKEGKDSSDLADAISVGQVAPRIAGGDRHLSP
jgi:hypothetical protein